MKSMCDLFYILLQMKSHNLEQEIEGKCVTLREYKALSYFWGDCLENYELCLVNIPSWK